MLVVMKQDATQDDVRAVAEAIEDLGYKAQPMPGGHRTTVGLIGNDGRVEEGVLANLEGVLRIIHVSQPYKLVSREWRGESTEIALSNGVTIGGGDLVVMAGPCSVESRSQILESAHAVAGSGGAVLRGGAFKPRTSPYSFQGLGVKGLEYLAEAREATGLAIVTEAVDTDGVKLVAEYADIIQIGARNMQNYSLLREAGRSNKPVLLKRGMSATVKELLLAAEYILVEGQSRVMLCERGVRNFDNHARNLFDLTAIVTINELSHLPVVADPSHGTGATRKVPPMARAAVAAGADALIVEVHPDPAKAASDGQQSLTPRQFEELMGEIRPIAAALGKGVATPDRVPQGALSAP